MLSREGPANRIRPAAALVEDCGPIWLTHSCSSHQPALPGVDSLTLRRVPPGKDYIEIEGQREV